MDQRIRSLMDWTRSKWGLDRYQLHTYGLRRHVNLFNETVYTLWMEWFPEHMTEKNEDGTNPQGTAIIEVDVHSRQFRSVIFVGGKTFADGVRFDLAKPRQIIGWIEGETGLKYGEQFQLAKEKRGHFQFNGCVEGTPVSPSALIEINVDETGRLTLFTIQGDFPAKDRVKEESFSLTLDEVKPLAKEQLTLIQVPLYEEKRFIPVYGVEEIYITNQQRDVIPCESLVHVGQYVHIFQTLHWQGQTNSFPFKRKEIRFSEDVTPEQAFADQRHPDAFPITKAEQKQCVQGLIPFMGQVYPDESGKWVLKTLHREKGYMVATLIKNEPLNLPFQRKLLVFLDPTTFQAINYMDNQSLLAVFQDFKQAENVVFTQEHAFEKLDGLITLTPVYLFDGESRQYILCGKLDCLYGVDAVSGKVDLLNEYFKR